MKGRQSLVFSCVDSHDVLHVTPFCKLHVGVLREGSLPLVGRDGLFCRRHATGSGAMQRSDASGVLPSVVVATAPRPSQQAISGCHDLWIFLSEKQHKAGDELCA